MEAARREAERIKKDLSEIRKDDVVKDLTEFVTVLGKSDKVQDILTRLDILEKISGEIVQTGILIPNKSEDKDFLEISGSIDANGRCIEGKAAHRGVLERQVNFKNQFAEPPKITMSIRNLTADTQVSALRTAVTVQEVTTTGFKASVFTWCNTKIYDIDASWIAVGSLDTNSISPKR